MTTTTFLAQFWGWLLVILSLIFLAKGKSLSSDLMQLIKDKTFVMLSGYLALILGLMTIILHNLWINDWRVVITIMGWISLLKGSIRIAAPKTPEKITLYFKNSPALIYVLLFVAAMLGIWLIWMSCNFTYYYY